MSEPLFPDLRPPPGGLAALHTRLERRRHRERWLGATGVVAVAAITVLVLRPALAPQGPPMDDPVILAMAGGGGTPVQLSDTARRTDVLVPHVTEGAVLIYDIGTSAPSAVDSAATPGR